MYAESGGKRLFYPVNEENVEWKAIELKHIKVKNGKVEIGFHVDGGAGAFCRIDDVSLVRE
ncbi:MAG: hypothetical protein V4592_11200 [Bacteroidota bacterium]